MNEKTEEIFTLDDGQKITAKELAKKLRMSNPGARARLLASTDPKVVFRKKGQNTPAKKVKPPPQRKPKPVEKPEKVNKEVQKRMYFDTLGHWALINKWI